ncbi:hypothetical protein M184_gp66 [Mycobacterium phage WIVsmall]|uniref:hypothetical protein n=1 Tax=Mycobacterium phage WIVsmall TaxID=1327036 RepID=UPI00032B6600|nr:hypothetical protein M184_gp66 [Mycobacterium phage WIVsmall]AGK88197.1 hypothetical protein WIVsmall_66 [Mycobacterium phage WIVsmall]
MLLSHLPSWHDVLVLQVIGDVAAGAVFGGALVVDRNVGVALVDLGLALACGLRVDVLALLGRLTGKVRQRRGRTRQTTRDAGDPVVVRQIRSTRGQERFHQPLGADRGDLAAVLDGTVDQLHPGLSGLARAGCHRVQRHTTGLHRHSERAATVHADPAGPGPGCGGDVRADVGGVRWATSEQALRCTRGHRAATAAGGGQRGRVRRPRTRRDGGRPGRRTCTGARRGASRCWSGTARGPAAGGDSHTNTGTLSGPVRHRHRHRATSRAGERGSGRRGNSHRRHRHRSARTRWVDVVRITRLVPGVHMILMVLSWAAPILHQLALRAMPVSVRVPVEDRAVHIRIVEDLLQNLLPDSLVRNHDVQRAVTVLAVLVRCMIANSETHALPERNHHVACIVARRLAWRRGRRTRESRHRHTGRPGRRVRTPVVLVVLVLRAEHSLRAEDTHQTVTALSRVIGRNGLQLPQQRCSGKVRHELRDVLRDPRQTLRDTEILIQLGADLPQILGMLIGLLRQLLVLIRPRIRHAHLGGLKVTFRFDHIVTGLEPVLFSRLGGLLQLGRAGTLLRQFVAGIQIRRFSGEHGSVLRHARNPRRQRRVIRHHRCIRQLRARRRRPAGTTRSARKQISQRTIRTRISSSSTTTATAPTAVLHGNIQWNLTRKVTERGRWTVRVRISKPRYRDTTNRRRTRPRPAAKLRKRRRLRINPRTALNVAVPPLTGSAPQLVRRVRMIPAIRARNRVLNGLLNLRSVLRDQERQPRRHRHPRQRSRNPLSRLIGSRRQPRQGSAHC